MAPARGKDPSSDYERCRHASLFLRRCCSVEPIPCPASWPTPSSTGLPLDVAAWRRAAIFPGSHGTERGSLIQDSRIRPSRIRHAEVFQSIATLSAPDGAYLGSQWIDRAGSGTGPVAVPTGITAYMKNGGRLEVAQQIANHESPRTTKLYDRSSDEISLDEIERIAI
jgi:hypothetical protein